MAVKRALSEEEYHAKAMLLGMRYTRKSNCIVDKGSWTWLDADTLEPVGLDERHRRREEYDNETGAH